MSKNEHPDYSFKCDYHWNTINREQGVRLTNWIIKHFGITFDEIENYKDDFPTTNEEIKQ